MTPKKQQRWTARKTHDDHAGKLQTKGNSNNCTCRSPPACSRPAWTLALASYFCSASLSSVLAFSSFVSASLSSCSASSSFFSHCSALRLFPAANACCHCFCISVARPSALSSPLCAVSSPLRATSRCRFAAARSCQVQRCFPVILRPCLPNTSVCRLGWSLVLQSCLLQVLVLHQQRQRPQSAMDLQRAAAQTNLTLRDLGGIFDRVSGLRRGSLLLDIPPNSFRCEIQNTRKGRTNLALSSSSSLCEGSEACAVRETTHTPRSRSPASLAVRRSTAACRAS